MPGKDPDLLKTARQIGAEYRNTVGGTQAATSQVNDEAHQAAAEAALRLEGIMANDPYLRQIHPAGVMQSMQTAWDAIKDYRDNLDGDHYKTAREKLKEAMESAKGLNRLSIDMGLKEIKTLLDDHPPGAAAATATAKAPKEGFTVSEEEFRPHREQLRAAAQPEIKAREAAIAIESGLRTALGLPPIPPQGGTFIRPSGSPHARPREDMEAFAKRNPGAARRRAAMAGSATESGGVSIEDTRNAAGKALRSLHRLKDGLPETVADTIIHARDAMETLLKEPAGTQNYDAAQTAIAAAKTAAEKAGLGETTESLRKISDELAKHAPSEPTVRAETGITNGGGSAAPAHVEVDRGNSGQFPPQNPRKNIPVAPRSR